ncbi:MAG: putative bifunctional diguanylate cyclase/phosphodiesterase, partial [Acidimicrobiales bacterium]
SIGIALGMSGVSTAEEMLRESDVAMYAAKRQPTGGVRVYEPDMREESRRRLQLKTELEHALVAEEFTVHYQPTVTLAGRTVTGFEALVRWQHPDRGLVPPNDIIPLAEETGLIVPLGRWVLRQACAQAAAWNRMFPHGEPRTMSVNLSIVQLQRADLVDQVAGALADSGLEPTQLMLEITETVLLDDQPSTRERLLAIKALGVRLAIDDFGTGYASLSQLRELPVDVLKIDKSFVDHVATLVSDAAMTKAIIEMGEALSLQLIAEGIENEAQSVALQQLRCRHGQGFMFARPLTVSDAETLLARPLAAAT